MVSITGMHWHALRDGFTHCKQNEIMRTAEHDAGPAARACQGHHGLGGSCVRHLVGGEPVAIVIDALRTFEINDAAALVVKDVADIRVQQVFDHCVIVGCSQGAFDLASLPLCRVVASPGRHDGRTMGKGIGMARQV